ncbi:MAG: UPF0175 family protein [bacterium]
MKQVVDLEHIEINLPKDLILLLGFTKASRMGLEDRIRLATAIDLFTAGVVSMAKAADIAGMHRYDFASLLNSRGIPVYEYTEREYQEDQEAISKYDELK